MTAETLNAKTEAGSAFKHVAELRSSDPRYFVLINSSAQGLQHM